MCQALRLGLLLILWGTAAATSPSQDAPDSIEKELNTPAIRGSAIFKARCASCHGERGDGSSTMARHHPELRAEIVSKTADYYQSAPRRRTQPASSTKFLRQHQMLPAEVTAVVAYLQIVDNPTRRGEIIYKSNCILCHGIHADGRGRASLLYNPRPADLRFTNKDDEYKRAIIRLGGASLGRSSAMPPWNRRITDAELSDLLDYLRSIKITSAQQ